jgi:hypothetical protein
MCDHSRYEDQHRDQGKVTIVTRVCLVCGKIIRTWTEPKR